MTKIKGVWYYLCHFRVYDEDGSGTVDREEMVEIVSNMYTSQGVAMVKITQY